MMFPGSAAKPVSVSASDRLSAGIASIPEFAGALGQGEVDSFAPLPAPIVTATAAQAPRKKPPHRPKPQPTQTVPAPSSSPTSSPTSPAAPTSQTPVGGASYAGSLVLDDSGSQLASWNQTNSFCPEQSWQVPDGSVSSDSGGVLSLGTTGTTGSCVAVISPGAYSSNVIEADIDFPALPGSSGTIADWSSFWLTDGATWPNDGELDAVEAQPVNGKNAVSWHSGTTSSPFTASTNGFSATTLPVDGGNVTPGWHTVDIVYTQGFFAVYYDGQEYTSYSSGNVTGSPLNVYLTTSVTPDVSSIQQELGGSPVNSDSSPADLSIKYLRVWSFK
jgi:hypothetical protein